MLSPDQLESAGDLVAAVYTEIEAQMLDHLVDALINGERLTDRTVTELALLSQTHDAALRKIVDDNRAMVEDAVLETAERFLRESDADDVERAGGDAKYPQQISATIAGMSTVLARDNLDMVDGAKRAFLTATTEAVTKTNSGLFTSEQAIHGAVRKLEREGIPIITYRNAKTGVQTVQNKVDVAVRRHVRTQISQDANHMTEERIRELDIDLVEVSSHPDARPSHAEWQGKCYSLKGEVVIDGTKYPDFWTSCMSGTLGDILGGVNCRHSYGPYRHGAPRAYSPNPQHPSGVPGSEIYEMEQHQRYLERLIRADKRELRGAQREYDKDPKSLTAKTNLLQAQKQLRDRQATMRKFIDESNAKSKNPNVQVLTRNPRREWAGDMPKVKTASGRIRSMATNRNLAAGYRTNPNHVLTASEVANIRNDAASIGIPDSCLRFNTGQRTGYSDAIEAITVKGDILPDVNSRNNRDTMTPRAVLAHEYYGHYMHRYTKLFPGDWRDEFRASYRAAIDTPNLSLEERASLMVDAYDRADEAGHALRKTAEYRKIVHGI